MTQHLWYQELSGAVIVCDQQWIIYDLFPMSPAPKKGKTQA